MSAGGDHADADVKSVEEILKSDGNDELKFGLLASLIKIGQVSTKDVVNTVLHLVSWVFKNIDVTTCHGHIVPTCQVS